MNHIFLSCLVSRSIPTYHEGLHRSCKDVIYVLDTEVLNESQQGRKLRETVDEEKHLIFLVKETT